MIINHGITESEKKLKNIMKQYELLFIRSAAYNTSSMFGKQKATQQ